MRKNIFLVLSLLIFSFFFLIIKTEKEGRLDMSVKGESYIEGVRIVHRKKGKNNWVLTAKRADISENGESARLRDIEMSLNNSSITIYADEGIYNLLEKIISVPGTVKAKESGYSITTSDIELNSADGILSAGGKVQIDGDNFRLSGMGMNMLNKEQKVRILNNVTATFNIN